MRISKLIKTIAYALIVCLTMVVVKDEFADRLLKSANYGMPALIEKGYVEDLYIGSSLFRQGLDIDVLEETCDDVYILSYNGDQPVFEYEQLKKILDSGVKIDRLYVDMFAVTAWAEPDLADEKYLMEIGIKEKWDTYQYIKGGGNVFGLFWQTFVSSNNEVILTWPISGRLVNNQFKNGGNTLQPVGASKEYLDGLTGREISGEMNDVQEQAIRGIVELCKDNNIEVCFVETPKYIKLQDDEGYMEATGKYVELLLELDVDMVLLDRNVDAVGVEAVELDADGIDVTEIATGSVIYGYGFECDNPDYFSDLMHMSYEGRKNFSEVLRDLK